MAQVLTVRHIQYRAAAAILFWPLVALAAYYLYDVPEFYVDESYKTWSIAHLILHLIPAFLYLTVRKNRTVNFPFIEVLAGFNVFHFALPVFYINIEDFQLGTLNPEALEYGFYAYALFYVTYYILFYSGIRIKPVSFVSKEANVNHLKTFAYVLLLFYFLKQSVSAIYHLGYIGFYIYLGLFIYFWRNKHLKKWEKILFLVVTLYDFFLRALDGLLSPVALFLLFLGACIIISHSNKLIITIGVVFFVWFYSIFSVIKFSFRAEAWYSGKEYGLLERIALINELYQREKLERANTYVYEEAGKNHFLWRFSYQASALSMVMEKTPEKVPYWNGETYLPLFTKYIPRFLWPDKPEETMGYKFGVAYGIMSTWNRSTSFNTPIMAETYMNFGFTGLYGGAMVLGFVFFILASLFNSSATSYANRIIGMAIIFPLMIWESNFSLTFGNILLVTLVLIFLYRIIAAFSK